jgi:hypothetical protein
MPLAVFVVSYIRMAGDGTLPAAAIGDVGNGWQVLHFHPWGGAASSEEGSAYIDSDDRLVGSAYLCSSGPEVVYANLSACYIQFPDRWDDATRAVVSGPLHVLDLHGSGVRSIGGSTILVAQLSA